MNYLAAGIINNPVLDPGLQALNGVTFTQKLVSAGILGGLIIGSVIFFINILVGGIAWINSGGDKAKTEAARSKITNAVVGLVVLFCVFLFISIAGTFLGTNLNLLDLNSIRIQ